MSNRIKTYSKSITDVENTTLKNKALFGGWLEAAFIVYRRDKMSGKALPNRFEDWIQRECGIKKQTIRNYKKLYKLANVAPKLFNCRVNTTYLIKNHDILIDYFQNNNTPWNHASDCSCQNCNLYFTVTERILHLEAVLK